jgi:rubrerythrin
MSTEETDEPTGFVDVTAGQHVYTEDGEKLGRVRGVDEGGFYVRTDDVGTLSLEDARDVFGKAYVMWRCWECGEMGQIEGQTLPESCPSCDAPREDLYYWAED